MTATYSVLLTEEVNGGGLRFSSIKGLDKKTAQNTADYYNSKNTKWSAKIVTEGDEYERHHTL